MSRSLLFFLALTIVSQACGDSKSNRASDPLQESAIDEFTLSAELLNLAPDEKAGLLTVTWRSRNTYKCQLTLGDGQSYPDRLPNDEIAGISVSVSTFVVLTCNDAQGNEVRAEKSIKLTRDPSNKLAILAFEAKPNNVVLAPSENEGTVQLKWQSQLASSCTLERLTPYSAMKVDVQGRDLPFQVWESTQLVLTCKDSTGSVQKTIGIKVGRSPGPEPKILDLAITPNPLFIFRDDGPQPITISWKTEGLNTCGLALKNESGNVEYLRGLDASGTNESFRINTTSDVTLSCQGPAGQDISKTIQAQVTTLDRPEKCEASERNLYFIRTLDDNATRFFSSQADRDKAFEDMQNLPICRDGNCVKEDKTHFTIKLNDKEAFVYGMNEKTLRDQHMATLQSSGFCSRPTRVSADAFYITIDGKNAFYIADNKERLNRLLEMFQKNLPSSKKCGVTSSYLTLDGRDVFYESDDSKRWNAFMSLEESGFCSVPTRVGANRSYITIDGRDVFYESDDAKRLQWMLTLSKKNILPEGSKCGANRSYISISGRDVFYESDDHKRSAILERLAVSGYCTSASPISANRSYITIDGRDVFYESDDGARLNWMLSLFQAGLFPAGTRCNANRSYITLDGRDVFYESDDRKRAQTLSVLFASGFCMGASELSANRSSLTLGGRDVFSFNDDDERLTRLMEGFKAGLGKPQSRCAANRSFVTLDKKDAFQASDDADRFQMLVKLEKSGFCSRPSRFGATTSAVTIDGRPVYIIADHEARLEKLIALFQGESE